MNRTIGITGVVAFLACAMEAWGQVPRLEMQRLPLDGGELEFQVLGEGPPVLLIHGGLIAGIPESFLTQPALSGWKLIVYHRRGYSQSSPETGPIEDYMARHAAEAAALLRHLDIERAHVFGHSSGGTIAMQLAFDHPELVESLVLLEPAIPALVQDLAAASTEGTPPPAEALSPANAVSALDFFMGVVAGQPEWRTRYSSAAIEQAEKDAGTFFAWEAPAIATWTPSQEQGALKEIPVLYVSGGRSPVPESYIDIVTDWFPDTEHVVIQDVSHGMLVEDPQSTAAGVASFLRQQ